MDSRPFRPRGVENMPPSLHQRHKSTGNLASASTASTASFRWPAKRAAFGDVTNLAKFTAGGDGGKVVKLQASAIGLSHAHASLNKENNFKNGVLSNTSQRPFSAAGKPKDVLLELPEPAPNAAPTFRSKTDALQPAAPEQPVTSNNIKEVEEVVPSGQPVQDRTSAPLSQHPRHHKSQPQLKQSQPSLRRTQSRQLESTGPLIEQPLTASAQPELPAMPSATFASGDSHLVSAEPLPIPAFRNENYETYDFQEDYMHLTSSIAIGAEDAAIVPVSYRDGLPAALSEPEEMWDEDEEDYDDQDQAYTTAHSFKSRDLTSNATTVLVPRVTAKVQRELDEAKIVVEATRTPDEIEDETWDVSMVAEYGDEIFQYLRDLEIKMLPNAHYMDAQTEIQWSMRSVLMDWLVQVHTRFSLLPETLFLTVNYIDRFLSNKIVSIGKLQLVGATAILVASKYEEINCPSLQEIVYMVDKGYTPDEILKAERFMLSMLGFELGWPGPMSFLRRVSKADDYDLDTRTLAKYFLELTIMDERFVATPPSFVAAAAHCLSRLILEKGAWTVSHVHYSGYTWSQLRSVVAMMIECCDRPEQHHQAVYDKYSEKRFKEAALTVQQALDAGFTLPNHAQPVRRSPNYSLSDLEAEQRIHQGHMIPIKG